MSPKHGIALLLSPHDGGEEEHDGADGEPASKEDAARAFCEAADKEDWSAAAKALGAFIDMHEESEGQEDEEHEDGEEG